jgi:dynein heavy chain
MYQTSLKQFLHFFDGSLSKSTRTPNILKRVKSVLNTLNQQVWAYTLRGLYEQHQFLFTILMAIKIDLHNRDITHAEFMKLIKGGTSLDLNTALPKPYKWNLMQCGSIWSNGVPFILSRIFCLTQQVHENEREWRSWVKKNLNKKKFRADILKPWLE